MRKKWGYISQNAVSLMQKMGSTWWMNWEGSHRADYLFSSQYFVLHTVFLPPSLSLYWWLSVSRDIITLSATARLQKQKRGESVFPLRESERKEMWLGTENESICMCMWTQILPTFKAILYRWGDLEGPTSTICWTSHHSCSRTQKFQENESFSCLSPSHI